jgi:hypothetical protein
VRSAFSLDRLLSVGMTSETRARFSHAPLHKGEQRGRSECRRPGCVEVSTFRVIGSGDVSREWTWASVALVDLVLPRVGVHTGVNSNSDRILTTRHPESVSSSHRCDSRVASKNTVPPYLISFPLSYPSRTLLCLVYYGTIKTSTVVYVEKAMK